MEDLNVFEGNHFPMKDQLNDMVTLIEAIQDCYHFIHPMDININQDLNNFVYCKNTYATEKAYFDGTHDLGVPADI